MSRLSQFKLGYEYDKGIREIKWYEYTLKDVIRIVKASEGIIR